MRIILHIGVPHCGAGQLQAALDRHRAELLRKGVLVSRTAGRKNHTKLYMAVSEPDHPDPLRLARGYATPAAQDRLRKALAQDILAEAQREPQAAVMVFSAPQLATLPTRGALERVKALLSPVSQDITILAHVEDQARVLLRHYAETLQEGRLADLTQEIAMAQSGGAWGPDALARWQGGYPAPAASGAQCPEVQAVPHWLDYTALVARWEEVFGSQKVILRPYDPARFAPEAIGDEISAIFGLKGISEKAGDAGDPAAGQKARRKKAKATAEAEAEDDASPPSAATLARWRQVNLLLERLAATGRTIPRTVWRSSLSKVAVQGAPPEAGALSAVSRHFEKANAALRKAHPALLASCFKPDRKTKDWSEAEPGFGFRATQYVAAFLPRIEEATAEAKVAEKAAVQPPAKQGAPTGAAALTPTPIAESLFSEVARDNFHHLKGGRFAPHNRIGTLNETALAPDFVPIVPRAGLSDGSSGKVIVGCMKNEAPYILEWVAYHRQIGVDNFLIYTNDCSDGTDEILGRLQELGIVEHRSNNDWKGNSPQQHALNKAMQEPVARNSDWLIHIDVDEFINVRTGNGTLDDFLAHVPEATNIAMTWRMFGHNGITRFEDRLVIGQFDQAAPKYCPKPHTSWGFKTMTRNAGIYSKLSCHRPNKIDPAAGTRVQWVNGSGSRMTPSYHEKGWRSDLVTIGYDMLQLNHYALRSAESFLVKRQRGRALHVDRSIGLNYWIRMDWSTNQDVTIKRNIPRVEAERSRLLEDAKLRQLHEAGVAWHRAKAAELHGIAEFEELYQQALVTKLTDLERVAMVLALDMET